MMSKRLVNAADTILKHSTKLWFAVFWLTSAVAICGTTVANDSIAVAFKDAKIVTQPGSVIEKGTVVVRDGLIEAVGADVEIPFDAKVIECDGLVLYAGFIDAGTTKGLPDGDEDGRKTGSGPDRRDIDLATQIAASTREVNRKGIYPDYSSSRFISVNDKDAKDWRKAGFTAIHVMPSGELLNGTTTVVALDDANTTAVRDSILQADFAAAGGWRSSGRGYPTSLMGSVAHLRQTMLDGQHYQASWSIYQKVKKGIVRPPRDPAMESVGKLLNGKLSIVFSASRIDEFYRARNLADEFGLQLVLDGVQHGYEFAEELKKIDVPVLLRISFSKKPELGKNPSRRFGRRGPVEEEDEKEQEKVETRVPIAKGVFEDRTKKWEAEVNNAATLAEADVEFVFSTQGTKDAQEFLKNLRLAIENGLDQDIALAALTVLPARLFNLQDQLGSIETGKIANLVVMSDEFGNKKTKVKYTVVSGKVFEQKKPDKKSKRGDGDDSGDKDPDKEDADKEDTGKEDSDKEDADEEDADEEDADKSKRKKGKEKFTVVDWPIETDESRVPITKTDGNVFISKANVITAVNGTLIDTSILIRDGKIMSIGKDLVPPEGVTVIDGAGVWVMPGIIDCHSHMVVGGNEGSLSVTPEVRCLDNMRSDDVSVYRAAAGGVTAANVLHGSANTIGGQRIVIQMKYKSNPQDMLFEDYAPGIKFALGENVIRSENRYPNTRMGVESVLRMAFQAARQYRSDWNRYNGLSDEEKARVIPPRRDLRLETLQGVLDNEILVHCHCYNAGEILMLLKTFSKFGIENLTLEHGLEAYKIAPEIVRFGKHGAFLSTFADFWGYKVEAYDAVPYNVALINSAGGVPILNSDSGERVRRLNHDAAKMVRWGGLSYQDAIRTITLNPAIALHLDDVVGSVEVGRKADLALYNGHPLNTFSRTFMTLIDGEVVFERGGELGGPYPLEPKLGIPASMPDIDAEGVYAITNAAIFTGTAPPIQQGTIVIRDGKILALGSDETIAPEGATLVDGSNLQVYPGLIDGGSTVANSDLGLSDAGENGQIKPDLQVSSALKPDSPLIGLARFTGATCSVTTPTDGLISGQSAVVQYDGWNFDDLLFIPQLALEMSLPSKKIGEERRSGRRFGRPRPAPAEDQPENPKPEISPYDLVKQLFEDTREYDRIKTESEKRGVRGLDFDSRLEAIIPYARKEKKVVIRVRTAVDILDAIEFAKELDIQAVLRDSGTESWKVADKLAEADIPILIGPITKSVSSQYDPYDTVYSLPARLYEAGVLFAFYSSSATSARDLPLSAGLAVGFGLPEDEAIAALTSNTAKIFGIDEQVGTLEVGKRADIIVTDRSPLQATSNVIHMFINGKPIDVDDNLHTKLYEKYRKRLKKQEPSEVKGS
jgi:imidazolonepropionase-like amidohydrolase